MLKGKTIVVGVTGGIAAYKAVEVVSRLKKCGANLHIIMTKAATQFVTPLTFREISGNPVISDMWSEPKTWNVEHIALASLADIFLVVPATANIIGKIANGIADDMLTTTVMATKAPVILAPAMNSNMFLNPVVQQNMNTLTGLGYKIIEPETGLLACGIEGPGRLPEPSVIVQKIINSMSSESSISQADKLVGKKVLVTAGGTREPIDPVRYIGNRSSGKMGYALAKAAAARGCKVTLISGPTNLPHSPAVKFKQVETALQMRDAVLDEFADTDIVIKAAAVSDYRVQQACTEKIKKTENQLTLILEKNPDILHELGKLKQNQFLVGFAAETQNLIIHAAEKLKQKNLDMIVANDITLRGAGFDSETNIIKILYRNGQIEELPQMAKEQLAKIILDRIYGFF